MHSRSKSCMIIPVQMRPAPKTKLFQLKRKFLFSFVSITLIFFHIFPFLKAPQVCTCGVFMPRRISLQFRHKFSMNYLNSLSNFVTIPDAGSCMIVSDKQMSENKVNCPTGTPSNAADKQLSPFGHWYRL